jgi:hypothetical protein
VRCPSHRGRRLIAANCHLGEDACARQLDGEVALAHTDGVWVSHAVAPAPCAWILTAGRHDGAHCRRVRPIAELGRSRRRIGLVDRVRTLMSRLPPGAELVPVVAPAFDDGRDDAAGELVAGGDLCPASPRELQRRSAATTGRSSRSFPRCQAHPGHCRPSSSRCHSRYRRYASRQRRSAGIGSAMPTESGVPARLTS